MIEIVRAFIEEKRNLSASEWQGFQAILQERVLKKGETLHRAGETIRGLYFIAKGAIRANQLKEDGGEVQRAFFFENEVATDYDSLIKQEPGTTSLICLEASVVYYADRSQMLALYQEIPGFEAVGRIFLEHLMVQQQKYAALFTLYTPSERYRYILDHHPELIQRVPLQYLASYLGIARETLSRIRKKMG